MINSDWPWPAVVSNPSLAPRLVTIALVAVVVALTRIRVWLRKLRESSPSADAAFSSASKNPWAGLDGVVGAFAVVNDPLLESKTAQSVKVPPISTPTIYFIFHEPLILSSIGSARRSFRCRFGSRRGSVRGGFDTMVPSRFTPAPQLPVMHRDQVIDARDVGVDRLAVLVHGFLRMVRRGHRIARGFFRCFRRLLRAIGGGVGAFCLQLRFLRRSIGQQRTAGGESRKRRHHDCRLNCDCAIIHNFWCAFRLSCGRRPVRRRKGNSYAVRAKSRRGHRRWQRYRPRLGGQGGIFGHESGRLRYRQERPESHRGRSQTARR